jgi:hypothetical protein
MAPLVPPASCPPPAAPAPARNSINAPSMPPWRQQCSIDAVQPGPHLSPRARRVIFRQLSVAACMRHPRSMNGEGGAAGGVPGRERAGVRRAAGVTGPPVVTAGGRAALPQARVTPSGHRIIAAGTGRRSLTPPEPATSSLKIRRSCEVLRARPYLRSGRIREWRCWAYEAVP